MKAYATRAQTHIKNKHETINSYDNEQYINEIVPAHKKMLHPFYKQKRFQDR